MAFTNTKGRYASFGIVTSLPDEVIDTFWYIIDNNLKGVFKLNNVLRFIKSTLSLHINLTFIKFLSCIIPWKKNR